MIGILFFGKPLLRNAVYRESRAGPFKDRVALLCGGETGFTVPIDDVPALTDRLLRLLTDRALARRMGEAGRLRAQRHFTWERVVQRMMQTIEPVVGALPRAG